MEDFLIFLDTYVLQKDMRIRMPKSILSNLEVEKGVTNFNIYLNQNDKTIILKPIKDNTEEQKHEK